MNKPGEEGQGVPFDLAEHRALVLDHQEQHATAEQGDDRGVVVHDAVHHEAHRDDPQNGHRPQQQSSVGDPRLRVLGDHRGDLDRVVREGRAEHDAAQHQIHPEQYHDDRAEVDEEVEVGQAGPAPDDDVRRVPDQRRSTTDVGGESFRQQVRGRSQAKVPSDRERHRRDQKHGRDVVHQRRCDRSQQDQGDHELERSAASQPHRQESQGVEESGLLDGPDDDHHAQEQEHYVPVDAELLGVERVVSVQHAQPEQQPACSQDDGDSADLLAGDQGVAEAEDGDGEDGRQGRFLTFASTGADGRHRVAAPVRLEEDQSSRSRDEFRRGRLRARYHVHHI